MSKDNIALGLAVVAIVIAAVALLIPGGISLPSYGTNGSCNGGKCTDYDAVDVTDGYYVDGTQLIDGSGNWVQAISSQTTDYWSVGGIDYASVQSDMTASSSVVCALANPWGSSGTTTVLNAMAQVTTNGIAVAQTLDMSTSTNASGPSASSSPAFVRAYSAGAGQFTFAWTPGFATSTSPSNGVLAYGSFGATGNSPFVLAPSEYLTLRIATSSPSALSAYYTGTCSATFMKP